MGVRGASGGVSLSGWSGNQSERNWRFSNASRGCCSGIRRVQRREINLMPVVPTYEQERVQSERLPTPYISPEAGAGIGRATEALGAGLAQVAETVFEVQQREK